MATRNSTPNWTTPIADGAGYVTQSWFEFFTKLTTKPQAIEGVNVTSSPFAYTASANGQIVVSGGTVSAITLTRARVKNLALGITSGLVALSQGDVVTVTYSGAPTVSFIPN